MEKLPFNLISAIQGAKTCTRDNRVVDGIRVAYHPATQIRTIDALISGTWFVYGEDGKHFHDGSLCDLDLFLVNPHEPITKTYSMYVQERTLKYNTSLPTMRDDSADSSGFIKIPNTTISVEEYSDVVE